jgi:hypothetical protein
MLCTFKKMQTEVGVILESRDVTAQRFVNLKHEVNAIATYNNGARMTIV